MYVCACVRVCVFVCERDATETVGPYNADPYIAKNKKKDLTTTKATVTNAARL